MRLPAGILLLVVGCLVPIDRRVADAGTDREAQLAAAERAALAAFFETYPARPDGPNRKPLHRVIVTLEPGVPLIRLLAALNGRQFTQQWCLMPAGDGALRVGLDTTHRGSRDDLLKVLNSLESVQAAAAGDDSKYLQQVLGPVRWREVSNFGPFELLHKHVTRGSRPGDVSRLFGKPHKTLEEGRQWQYECLIGPHAAAAVTVYFKSGRVTDSRFYTEFHGPPVR